MATISAAAQTPITRKASGCPAKESTCRCQADRVEAGTERDLRWIDLPEQVRECVFNLCNEGFADYIEAAPAAETRDEARDWQGLWDSYDKRTPIYCDGDAYRIRDDERCPLYRDDKVAAGPFATFADAVRYMLPSGL
jgi:hypothetical protein